MTEDDLVYGTTAEAAQWLARVGLRGRYVATPGGWLRDGQPCTQADVHTAMRLALEAVYDRRTVTDPSPALTRLLDVRWRLGPLLKRLRQLTEGALT